MANQGAHEERVVSYFMYLGIRFLLHNVILCGSYREQLTKLRIPQQGLGLEHE